MRERGGCRFVELSRWVFGGWVWGGDERDARRSRRDSSVPLYAPPGAFLFTGSGGGDGIHSNPFSTKYEGIPIIGPAPPTRLHVLDLTRVPSESNDGVRSSLAFSPSDTPSDAMSLARAGRRAAQAALAALSARLLRGSGPGERVCLPVSRGPRAPLSDASTPRSAVRACSRVPVSRALHAVSAVDSLAVVGGTAVAGACGLAGDASALRRRLVRAARYLPAEGSPPARRRRSTRTTARTTSPRIPTRPRLPRTALPPLRPRRRRARARPPSAADDLFTAPAYARPRAPTLAVAPLTVLVTVWRPSSR